MIQIKRSDQAHNLPDSQKFRVGVKYRILSTPIWFKREGSIFVPCLWNEKPGEFIKEIADELIHNLNTHPEPTEVSEVLCERIA